MISARLHDPSLGDKIAPHLNDGESYWRPSVSRMRKNEAIRRRDVQVPKVHLVCLSLFDCALAFAACASFVLADVGAVPMMLDPRTPKPVSAVSDGVDVHAYGQFDVLAVSPDYFPARTIQSGNELISTKIRPKKSWEITSHIIGLTPTRLPSWDVKDVELYHHTHLIDGDPTTVGFAGTTGQATIRIQLPRSTTIESVRLVSGPGGRGFPTEFEIRVYDWHIFHNKGEWQTVYAATDDGEYKPGEYGFPGRPAYDYETTKPDELFLIIPGASPGDSGESIVRECRFEAVEAREVWLYSPQDMLFAEVEVLDEAGNNVALLAKGADVTVSRTIHTFWQDPHTDMWSLTYDLGLKWLRVNYWWSTLIWQFVEREKGVYSVDAYTDAMLTQAADAGVEIVMSLGGVYGLPNHADYPEEAERIEGFTNYCRFMAEHFEGRVRYYEVFNEFYEQHHYQPNFGPYEKAAAEYVKYAVPAFNAIREAVPDAKLILLGPDPLAWEFIEASLQAGLAGIVDGISWHQYQWTMPPEVLDRPNHPWAGPEITTYAEAVRYVQDASRKYGIQEFHNNEAGAYTFYWSEGRPSSLVAAKYLARSMVLHTTLGVPTFWNETNAYFRQTGGPPKLDYSYYICRTLCTLMDGADPLDLDFAVAADVDQSIEKHAFRYPDGDVLLAVWIPDVGEDDYNPVEVSITVPIPAARAVGYELLNGTEQPLELVARPEGTGLDGLLLRDYPLFVRLSE